MEKIIRALREHMAVVDSSRLVIWELGRLLSEHGVQLSTWRASGYQVMVDPDAQPSELIGTTICVRASVHDLACDFLDVVQAAGRQVTLAEARAMTALIEVAMYASGPERSRPTLAIEPVIRHLAARGIMRLVFSDMVVDGQTMGEFVEHTFDEYKATIADLQALWPLEHVQVTAVLMMREAGSFEDAFARQDARARSMVMLAGAIHGRLVVSGEAHDAELLGMRVAERLIASNFHRAPRTFIGRQHGPQLVCDDLMVAGGVPWSPEFLDHAQARAAHRWTQEILAACRRLSFDEVEIVEARAGWSLGIQGHVVVLADSPGMATTYVCG